MAQSIKLLSTTNRVEAPFIQVNIGGYVFGKYSRKVESYISPVDGFTKQVTETFPNYVQSLVVQKLNGQVNNYTLTLIYVIRPGDDPNKIDKILSTVSHKRTMNISYGDCNAPSYIYKDEEALITSVTQSVNITQSQIIYTIQGVSSAKLSTQGNYYFPARNEKPSTVIRDYLLYDNQYGLLDVFYGMRNKVLVENEKLLPTEDKQVQIEAKTMSPFDYLNYLVSCMCSEEDNTETIDGRHRYFITCIDDTSGKLGGPYFKVQKVANNIQETKSIDTYEVDVGFPDSDLVLGFNILTNDAYSILYNYSEEQKQDAFIYRINDSGLYDSIYSPGYLWDKSKYMVTEQTKTWWAQMTQYPIQVELTLKGLLKPAILMSYVKLNTYFYGRKHSSSGTYIITKQVDTIDTGGYKSSLLLTRIKGDDDLN